MEETRHSPRLAGYEGLAASIIACAIYDLKKKKLDSREYYDALKFLLSPWCERLAEFINWDYMKIRRAAVELDETRRARSGDGGASEQDDSRENFATGNHY